MWVIIARFFIVFFYNQLYFPRASWRSSRSSFVQMSANIHFYIVVDYLYKILYFFLLCFSQVPFCGFDPSPPATKREVRLSDKLTPVTRDHSPESAPTPRRGNLFSPHRPLFCLDSPGKSYGSEEDDENSQDSGVCMDKQDGGEFKCPLLPAPRPRKLSIGTDNATSSPLKYSSSPKCKAMPLVS